MMVTLRIRMIMAAALCAVALAGCVRKPKEAVVLHGMSTTARGGEPVLGTGHEERCAEAITAIVDGGPVERYLSDVLIVGPGFAHAMAGDQVKFRYGKAILITGVFDDRRVFLLGRGVLGSELATMFKSKELRDFLRGFKGQRAEPASSDERDIYYSLIAWQIAGQPVTVIRDGTRRLLLQGTDEGKLHWMDMIDQYPVPSVAPNAEEALKLIATINQAKAP